MAQEITRDMAEAMIMDYDVLDSCKNLDSCIIIISFKLSNSHTLIVNYNIHDHHKTYFLEKQLLFNSSN